MTPELLAPVAAPFVGSFIGVLALRYPRLAAALAGRSHCPKCRHVLGPLDLVPVLSWLVRHGRCRHCGEAVSAFYPAIELAALIIALWTVSVVSGWLIWASCALGWTLLALAAIDARRFVLPDALTLPLLAGGLAVTWVNAPERLPDHIVGAAAGFAAFAGLAWAYRRWRGREGLGLGDAKLLAAGGAWLSWAALPSVILLAALLGLAGAVGLRAGGRAIEAGTRLAFGPFLALAIWLAWLYGPLELAG